MFEKIMECVRNEVDFNPSLVENRGGNHLKTIRMDSPEAQIMADGLESGLSIRNTWLNINKHRLDNGDDLISESCVTYALQAMKPRLSRVKKRKQGSSDPKSSWSQARYAWTTQLLARFGSLDQVHPVEKRFDAHIVGKLDLHQIVWWDETHRKCLIGGQSSSKNFRLRFPRNKQGKLDVVHGKYSEEDTTILNVKYEKECRLGLGVAMVMPLAPDGTTLQCEGKRCYPFNYSTKVLISIDDYKKMKRIEINRVKNLSGRMGFWVESNRDAGMLYQNDPVSLMKGVGKKTVEKLESIGIKTVRDLKKISNPKDVKIPDGISINKITSLWDQASKAVEVDCPPDIDHRKEDNPYKSKFGKKWKNHLKKVAHIFTFSMYI